MSLTNGERANRGIAGLAVASDLSAVARRHSSDMAAGRQVYDDPNLPNEVSGWRGLAENSGRGSSASSVHNAFMSSSVHRENILNPSFNQIGVGTVWGSDGYLYVTEVFAARGSAHVTVSVVHHHHALAFRGRVKPRVRTRPSRRASVAALYPDLTVGMLLRLFALDPTDTGTADATAMAQPRSRPT